jgi:hypothetical protein
MSMHGNEVVLNVILKLMQIFWIYDDSSNFLFFPRPSGTKSVMVVSHDHEQNNFQN